MSKLVYVLVLLADFANGIFATLLAGWLSGVDLLWWHFLIGIVFAMLPDLDALPELWQRGRVSAAEEHPHDHRSLLHYPIFFVVLGTIFLWAHPFYGSMFLIAVVLHFINDMYGTGWGIPIFWPLSTANYKIFTRRVGRLKKLLVESGDWEKLPDSERRWRIYNSWSQEELPSYIKTYGMDKWMEPYYLKINFVSGTEYLLFLIAVIFMIGSLL